MIDMSTISNGAETGFKEERLVRKVDMSYNQESA